MWSSYFGKALDKMSIEIGKTEKNFNMSYKFWFTPIFHRIFPFISSLQPLGQYNVA